MRFPHTDCLRALNRFGSACGFIFTRFSARSFRLGYYSRRSFCLSLIIDTRTGRKSSFIPTLFQLDTRYVFLKTVELLYMMVSVHRRCSAIFVCSFRDMGLRVGLLRGCFPSYLSTHSPCGEHVAAQVELARLHLVITGAAVVRNIADVRRTFKHFHVMHDGLVTWSYH